MKKVSIGGFLFLGLFGLPFLGMGLAFAIVSANRGGSDQWFGILLGSFFACIGAGLIALAGFGYRMAKREAARVAENPEQPWLWREDWAAGRAKGTDPKGNITMWGVCRCVGFHQRGPGVEASAKVDRRR